MRIVYDEQTQLQINMYKKYLIHNSVLDHTKFPYCHMHTIYRVQSSSIMNWLNQRQNLFIMGTFFQFQFGNGFWYDFPIIYRNLFRQMFLLLHIPSCILNLISILKMRGVCKSVYTTSICVNVIFIFLCTFQRKRQKGKVRLLLCMQMRISHWLSFWRSTRFKLLLA